MDWLAPYTKASKKFAFCQVLYNTKYYLDLRYRPNSAFQRIVNTSTNICTLSRIMFTFVAGECAQRTGISTDFNP